jgi:hypothetical protein
MMDTGMDFMSYVPSGTYYIFGKSADGSIVFMTNITRDTTVLA